jgi:multidrug efflux pump
MGGLFVATFLTLLFLPSLYALWYRKRLDERGHVGDTLGGALPPDALRERVVPLAVAAE